MDAIAKLQELYNLRKHIDEPITAIETLLGVDPAKPKTRKPRGPNKPKDLPANNL
jgi:hypothetical protein